MAEVGIRFGAGSSSPAYIRDYGMLFQNTHIHTVVIPANQKDYSFQTAMPNTDIAINGHWVMFSKTTQDRS